MEPVSILVTLVIIGLVLHLVITYVPMHPAIQTILVVAAILFTLIWLFTVAGITHG